MNERIRLLAEQAGFFPEPNWDHTGWHAAGHNDTFEKLALLIVRECANQCDLLLNNKMSSEWARGTHDCSKAIREHFGVKGD